jgi:hypothetical protein
MGDELPFLWRSAIGKVFHDNFLNPENLPQPSRCGAAYEEFLPVVELARIPEPNIVDFLKQTGDWFFQYLFVSTLDGDRRQFKAAWNEVKTASKRLSRALAYLDKYRYASFMLNTQIDSRLEERDLPDFLYASQREEIIDSVMNSLPKGAPQDALRQAWNSAIDSAMEPETPQTAALKHQLKILTDAVQFLSTANLPKPRKGQNRTKSFIAGILRIVKSNGGNLTYNKNNHTGSLADVYEFFRAKMPAGTWTDLSSSTLQRIKNSN